MKRTLNMQQPAPAPKPLRTTCGKNVSCKVADCTQAHAGVGATAAMPPGYTAHHRARGVQGLCTKTPCSAHPYCATSY